LPPGPYIAIEGVIGVGKTTLARLLQPALNAQLLLEVFEENPFLSDFYADRARYAFQTQIFFLLSRYRQQHQVVARLLERGPVLSDYTFAKDRLFARLNLSGDELATYERLHAALAENVVVPDLIVYLYADPSVLMERIAVRDRPYERGMSRAYIEGLVEAYEGFAHEYTEAPILRIDTNALDYVRSREDLAPVVQRVRSALGQGTHQPSLPQFGGAERRAAEVQRAALRRRLADLQRLRRLTDGATGPAANPYYELMRLQERVGQLAGMMAQVLVREEATEDRYGNRLEAQQEAVAESRRALQEGLVECLTYVLSLANGLGVDLESAYVRRFQSPGGADAAAGADADVEEPS
jgi:deoxyguanosine kinase